MQVNGSSIKAGRSGTPCTMSSRYRQCPAHADLHASNVFLESSKLKRGAQGTQTDSPPDMCINTGAGGNNNSLLT
eukprot:776123-Pelagomonas_calceolata.AAC.4